MMTSRIRVLLILLLLVGYACALASCDFPFFIPRTSQIIPSPTPTTTATSTSTATPTQSATASPSSTSSPTPTATATPSSTATATATATATHTNTPTPTPTQAKALLGPDQADFPPNYNPLTGLPVTNPDNLNLPAILISITNFPPSARPQAGLSFAPYIFELFIGEGMTRFLALFYGEFPISEELISGDCPIREGPFTKTGTILGNYVWSDDNANGIQDVGERGIAGVCVHLHDGQSNQLLETTTTDSNGFYGFNVDPKRVYTIKFDPPPGLVFTKQDAEDDDHVDSDADPSTGQTTGINLSDDDYRWDAGLKPGEGNGGGGNGNGGGGNGGGNGEKKNGDGEKKNGGKVGPVRSGRLPYKYLANLFAKACLIFAGSSYDVPVSGCASVFGTDKSDINSAYLAVDRLIAIAKQVEVIDRVINYSSNLFLNVPLTSGQYQAPKTKPELNIGDESLVPPETGGAKPPPVSIEYPQSVPPREFPETQSNSAIADEDALEVLIFYNYYNQAQWLFDPLSGGYLRYIDNADGTGIFYPATDQLNQRQLIFHNVIILFANHNAIKPTIIDIELEFARGPAILFRDGKAHRIYWSTLAGEYEQETGQQRPIKFVDIDGNLFPLHPGQTWVHIVTMNTSAWEEAPSKWKVRFYAPPGTQ